MLFKHVPGAELWAACKSLPSLTLPLAKCGLCIFPIKQWENKIK